MIGKKKKGIEHSFESNLDHFYLSGKLLPIFSESLIQKAQDEILIANPYVRRCHICESLRSMSEKGVQVKMLTREIESPQFKRELSKGVMISYDESVHAKLIIVDRRVGIVSSMNFYAGSTAGQSWEAGIVTTNRAAVISIANSVLGKIKEQKMLLDTSVLLTQGTDVATVLRLSIHQLFWVPLYRRHLGNKH